MMFTLLEVTGEEAGDFLQAQLTQDIGLVRVDNSPLGAWCNPQGRVIVVARLLVADGGFALVLPHGMAEAVRRRLERYRLRARVNLSPPAEDWRALAVEAPADLERLAAVDLLPAERRDASRRRQDLTAVRLAGGGDCIELYGRAAALPALARPLGEDAWRAARLRAGIADIDAAHSEKFTPHMLNLDRIGALHFDKGCYAGQEIVARTEYRGNVKRRLAHFRADGPLAAGDTIDCDGRTVGEVLGAADGEVLALLDVVLHGRTMQARGAELRPAPD